MLCKKKYTCNYLIIQVLGLLHLLVNYGYYSNLNDINELMDPLVSLLDGKDDKPFPDANGDECKPFRHVR